MRTTCCCECVSWHQLASGSTSASHASCHVPVLKFITPYGTLVWKSVRVHLSTFTSQVSCHAPAQQHRGCSTASTEAGACRRTDDGHRCCPPSVCVCGYAAPIAWHLSRCTWHALQQNASAMRQDDDQLHLHGQDPHTPVSHWAAGLESCPSASDSQLPPSPGLDCDPGVLRRRPTRPRPWTTTLPSSRLRTRRLRPAATLGCTSPPAPAA